MHGRARRGGKRGAEYGQTILPVGELPADFNGVPLDGEQYLAMVRYVHGLIYRREASMQPRILYSAAHATTAPAAQALKSIPAETTSFFPDASWRSVFLERFERLHKSLKAPPPRSVQGRTRVPDVSDEAAWYRFVHGRAPPDADERSAMLDGALSDTESFASAATSEAEVDDMLESEPTGDVLVDHYGFAFQEPSMRILTALDTLFRKWMQQPYFVLPYDDAPLRYALHPLHTRWLFSLLAHLDRRLSGEEIAGLRALARSCIAALTHVRSLRAQAMADSDDDFLEQESGAWMLLVIVAGVWGQRDLWDEAKARTSTPSAP